MRMRRQPKRTPAAGWIEEEDKKEKCRLRQPYRASRRCIDKVGFGLMLLFGAVHPASPVRWEQQITPGGRDGPNARFGHQAAMLDFPSGVIYVFGGLVGGRGSRGRTSGGQEGRGQVTLSLSSDVWMYDSRGQLWEKAAQLPEAESPLVSPQPRAFHTMISTGESALVCGGHENRHPGPSSKGLISDSTSKHIDCWWLTPAGYFAIKWDRLVLRKGSHGPTPRSGHTMTFDETSGAAVLWGGLGNSTALNDCWIIRTRERLSLSDAAKFTAQNTPYVWHHCDYSPIPHLSQQRPPARWGHVAVFFQSRLYIQGGVSLMDGGRVKARDDMWVMHRFQDVLSRTWKKISPSSNHGPAPRAFHAAWLVGPKMCIVAGQGETGHGVGLVLGDTWCYHLVPNIWTQLSMSPHKPTGAHLALISLHSNGAALAFGGQEMSMLPSNGLFEFASSNPHWRRVALAGLSPRRRAGHVSFISSSSSEIFVGLGQTAIAGVHSIVNDLWVFDSRTRIWQCIYGEDSSCGVPLSTLSSSAIPPPMAYAASITHNTPNLGVIFGGFAVVRHGSDSNNKILSSNSSRIAPMNYGRAWVLHLSGRHKHTWQEIVTENSVFPPARGLSAMQELESFDFSGKVIDTPLLLFGGADWSCYSKGCQFPKPLSDLWLLDMAKAPVGQSPPKSSNGLPVRLDQTAVFDGVDDIVSVPLPPWCKEPNSVGVLWIDFWMRYTQSGDTTSYLVEALSANDESVVNLRWFLQGQSDNLYVSLLLHPGEMQQLVRRWGPIASVVGVWRHVTFTIRTTPVYSSKPKSSMLIAQAFFFIDFVQVPTLSQSSNHDAHLLDTGLSSIILGGSLAPTVQPRSLPARPFSFFEGEMDDFRVWWRACPIPSDPSACDPYAFTQPRLYDGTIVPAARRADGRHIHLQDVEFDDIARPVRIHLFARDDPRYIPSTARDLAAAAARADDGLILHLDFNTATAFEGALSGTSQTFDDTLLDASIVAAPAFCTNVPSFSSSHIFNEKHSSMSCPACSEECTYSQSQKFLASTIEESWALGRLLQNSSGERYADLNSISFCDQYGWCECLDADKCPPEPFFHCPSLFVRVCDLCAIPSLCSSGLNAGLPCNLLSADDEDEGGCIDIENNPEEQEGSDGVEGNATQMGSGGGSLCKALDSRSCPDTLCRRWRCEALLFSSQSFSSALETNSSRGTEDNESSDDEEKRIPPFQRLVFCRANTHVGEGAGPDQKKKSIQHRDASLESAPAATNAPLVCAANQTLIQSKEGERQQCCGPLHFGGVMRGHVCRHWTTHPGFVLLQYDPDQGETARRRSRRLQERVLPSGGDPMGGGTKIICDDLVPASVKWEHDCGIRACCVQVNTEELLQELHLEELAGAAQDDNDGCYTELPDEYVGEDDFSLPPSIKTCSLPEGTLLSTTFETELLEKLLSNMSFLLDQALEKWHPPVDGNSSNSSNTTAEEEYEGQEEGVAADDTEQTLGAENVTAHNSTDGEARGNEGGRGQIDLVCTESPGEMAKTTVPEWMRVCGHDIGFPHYLRPGPPSFAEFQISFTKPIGPLTLSHLRNLVQLVAGMGGIDKSERHLISVRQQLQVTSGQVRALTRIMTSCPIGAIRLRQLITKRLQVDASNRSDDLDLFGMEAGEDDAASSDAAASDDAALDVTVSERSRYVRELLQDTEALQDEEQAGAQDGNFTNVTEEAAVNRSREDTERFVFTTWQEGLVYFSLPESLAGAERAAYCGDGVVEFGEQCDDGSGNGPFLRCSANCSCNPGYALSFPPLPPQWTLGARYREDENSTFDQSKRGVCMCIFDSDFQVRASESNSEMMAPNNITVEISMSKSVRGCAPMDGHKEGSKFSCTPVEIKIMNLTGSLLPDDVVKVHCEAKSWKQCHVGVSDVVFGPAEELLDKVDPEADNSTESPEANITQSSGKSRAIQLWQRSAATWERARGSLRFFILQDLPAGEVLKVTVTLVNRDVAQPPRLAQVSVCSNIMQVDDQSRVLASNLVSIMGPVQSAAKEGGEDGQESIENEYEGEFGFDKNLTSLQAPPPVCQSFPCNFTLREATEQGDTVEIANVHLGEAPVNRSVLKIELISTANQVLDLQENFELKELMYKRLEEGSAIAGLGGAVLKISWSGPAIDIVVSLNLDERVVRRQAGCRTVESLPGSGYWEGTRLEMCLGGQVQLQTFNAHSQTWTPASNRTRNVSVPLTSTFSGNIAQVGGETQVAASNAMYLTAITGWICCHGRSCGDAVCPSAAATADAFEAADLAAAEREQGTERKINEENKVKLGNGVAFRMPVIQKSQRPVFETIESLHAYVTSMSHAGAMTSDNTYKAKSNWTQICPTFPTSTSFTITATSSLTCEPEEARSTTTIVKAAVWPSARYAHAMQKSVIGRRSVLIYGGVGCFKYASGKEQGFCLETQVLDDLWEFNPVELAFKKLEVSPKLPVFGHLFVQIPNGGLGGGCGKANVIAIGGSKSFSHQELFWGDPRPRTITTYPGATSATTISEAASPEALYIRHFYLQEDRSSTQVVSPVGGMWGSSVVSNSTHAIVFGGFFESTLSNTIYSYDLRVQEEMQVGSIEKTVSAAHRPAARAFANVIALNTTFAVWGGGVFRDPVSQSLMPRGDIWALSTKASDFGIGVTVPQFYTRSQLPDTYPMFARSFCFEISGLVLMVSHGGILKRLEHWQDGSNSPPQNMKSPVSYKVTFELDQFRVLLLAKSEGYTRALADVFINGQSCSSRKVTVVHHNCNRDAPHFNPEGWVCAYENTQFQAYCSYGVGISACARCEDKEATIGGLSSFTQELMLAPPDRFCEWCSTNEVELESFASVTMDALFCMPSVRFMQSVTRGNFLGANGVVLYGGIDQSGASLADLWYMDLAAAYLAHKIDIVLKGVDTSVLNASAFLRTLEADLWDTQTKIECTHLDITRWFAYMSNLKVRNLYTASADEMKENDADKKAFGVKISFVARSTFIQCVSPDRIKAWADERGWLLILTPVEWSVDTMPQVLTVPMWQYVPEESTNTQKSSSSSSKTAFPNRCSMEGSLPGPRHGHTAVSVQLHGLEKDGLLIYGGESTDLDTMQPHLSSEVHIAIFKTHHVSFTMPTLVDAMGRLCKTTGDCPRARRDASSLIIGNENGRFGRLIVFGGLTNKKYSDSLEMLSPLRAYLDGDASPIEALADLWCLDLSGLSTTCDGHNSQTRCSVGALSWTRITVAAPSTFGGDSSGLRRWGATLLLDNVADTIIIVGGASIEEASLANGGIVTDVSRGREVIVEHDDTFVLPFHQALLSTCKLTDTPQRTQAGSTVSFLVKCYDLLGYPSTATSISATFSGPVNLEPICAADSLTSGVSICRFTAFVAGLYQASVLVSGAGQRTIDGQLLAEFWIKVEASSVSWPKSEVLGTKAEGLHATVGQMSNIMIQVADAHGNVATQQQVRNVVDFVLVLESEGPSSTTSARNQALISSGDDFQTELEWEKEQEDMLKSTASALDAHSLLNWHIDSDGNYKVDYWVTRSGRYTIHASSSVGISIVGSKRGILHVTSSSPVIVNSYVYGQIAMGEAGRPSVLYVQTRDIFGNKASQSDSFEDIQVNLCLKLGGTQGQACGGIDGFRIHDVSVVTEYLAETKFQDTDLASTGSTGVYKLTLNFFTNGNFILLVLHNMTILNCYFDFPFNPGHQLADMCTKQDTSIPTRLTTVVGTKVTADGNQPSTSASASVDITRRQDDSRPEYITEDVMTDNPEDRSETLMQVNSGELHSMKHFTIANISLGVKAVFDPPNLKIIRQFLLYLPIAAACAAILLQGMCYFFSAISEPTHAQQMEVDNASELVVTKSSNIQQKRRSPIQSRMKVPARDGGKALIDIAVGGEGHGFRQRELQEGGKPGQTTRQRMDMRGSSISDENSEGSLRPHASRFALQPFRLSGAGLWIDEPSDVGNSEGDFNAGGVFQNGSITDSRTNRRRLRDMAWAREDRALRADVREQDWSGHMQPGGRDAEQDASLDGATQPKSLAKAPPEVEVAPPVLQDSSLVDQFLSRSLSPEAIRTLKEIKGISLRPPSAIIATSTFGSKLVRTQEKPFESPAFRLNLDTKADIGGANSTSEHASPESGGIARDAINETRSTSGIAGGLGGDSEGSHHKCEDVGEGSPSKRKKSQQQLVFKPNVKEMSPTSPKHIEESQLTDIDEYLDFVTLMEDEKVISADEAISGRQAVLRGDPKISSVLKCRAAHGQKGKIAAAIRQLHANIAATPPDARMLALDEGVGNGGAVGGMKGVSLSSRPPRNTLQNVFGRIGSGLGGASI